MPPELFFDICKSRLEYSDAFKVKRASESLLMIFAESNELICPSKIMILLCEDTINETKVIVSSRPLNDWTSVDYGKNIKNMRLIENLFKEF